MRIQKTINQEDIIGIDIDLCTTLWRKCVVFSQSMPCMRDLYSNYCDIADDIFSLNDFFDNVKLPDLDRPIFSDKSNQLGLDDILAGTDSVETELRRSLFCNAIAWIVHHELAHIWNGHLEYNSRDIRDKDESEKDKIRHTLEFDADSRAVRGVVTNIKTVLNKKGLRNSEKDIIYLIICASEGMIIGFFTSLLIAHFQRLDESTRYPHAFSRIEASRSGLVKALKEQFGNIADYDNLIEASMITYVINLRCNFYTAHLILSELTRSDNDEAMQSERFRLWNEIAPILTKYMRGFAIPGPYINGTQTTFYARDGKPHSQLTSAISARPLA